MPFYKSSSCCRALYCVGRAGSACMCTVILFLHTLFQHLQSFGGLERGCFGYFLSSGVLSPLWQGILYLKNVLENAAGGAKGVHLWQSILYVMCSWYFGLVVCFWVFFTSRKKGKKKNTEYLSPSHKLLILLVIRIQNLGFFDGWWLLNMPSEFQLPSKFKLCLSFPAITIAVFPVITALLS